jgi:hypothetical protein
MMTTMMIGPTRRSGGAELTDEEELLLVQLCAEAVRHDDPALRVVVARLLDFQPLVELRLAYRIAEQVLRDVSFTPDYLPLNGDSPHD